MDTSDTKRIKRRVVDVSKLPKNFPTHLHQRSFWEALGRTVATYGFLEEVLAKAIFAFTATREYEDHEVEVAYAKWLPVLESALIDPLGNLVKSYDSAVKAHPKSTITNLDELIEDLKKAAALRNVLCHGSWRKPDELGRSVPRFINRKKEVFETAVDLAFLEQTQGHIAELICAIVSTVEHMGWQFPGSSGEGQKIWP
jgi:uncharacterized protein YutE (UPF0331/DUF86 family)